MPTYVQAERPMTVSTPLGADALLLVGLTGHEAISRLFEFELDVLAENATDVAFDKLLGQGITAKVKVPDSPDRFFNGICNRVTQGERDLTFTTYRLQVVPRFWLLTKHTQSRIFQQLSVPDILKKVLTGLDVAFELHGTFHARDYCVQYRESDFAFASRLMEEEGIYYFFKHTDGGHKMVLANTPQSHPDVAGRSEIPFDPAPTSHRVEGRISEWGKSQELRAGKVTLWDHCFEMPHKHLEAEKTVQESVAAGKVTHKLKVGGNDKFELYDFPGQYAQRFDGIDPGGGGRAGDLQNIFEDNTRTAGIRMQQETAGSLVIQGASNCAQLTSGYKFTLAKHFNADGAYVLTGVHHRARLTGTYRSNGEEGWQYSNRFECIPSGVPYRPVRTTPKPTVRGSQTAVVTGPGGEEIFCDKYGRVKVQFHWDREGKNDASSSCWCRVATLWAGKQWGVVHIPRMGQEVVVDFLEGDPDQPIIVGSVYNAEMMPPYELPAHKTQSGLKSRSSLGGSGENFNEICFEDKKGEELLYIRAEKDQTIAVENDEAHWVGRDRQKTVDRDETTEIGRDRTEHVLKDESITIDGHRKETVHKSESIVIDASRTENVGKNESITIGGNRGESVGGNESITVTGNRTESVGKDESVAVEGNRTITVQKDNALSVKQSISMSAKKDVNLSADGKMGQVAKDSFTITSDKDITLKCGDASIVLNKDGTIDIKGAKINIKGSDKVSVKGSEVNIN